MVHMTLLTHTRTEIAYSLHMNVIIERFNLMPDEDTKNGVIKLFSNWATLTKTLS